MCKISEHRLSHNHDFNWTKPEILYKERHKKTGDHWNLLYQKTLKYDQSTKGYR